MHRRSFFAGAHCLKLALAVGLFVSGLGCARTGPPGNKDVQQRSTIRSESIASVAYGPLGDARIRGSIVIRECYDSMGEPQNYPIRSTLKTADWKAVLNNIVTQYPAVSWKSDSGIVRVSDKFAEPRLLAVKIKDVNVAKVYDGWQVLPALKWSPELRDFMTREGSEFLSSTSEIHQAPYGKARRVHFEDKTVAEALDELSRQFPGFWTYQECDHAGKKQVWLDFWQY